MEDLQAMGIGPYPGGGSVFDRMQYLEESMKHLLTLYKQLSIENKELLDKKEKFRLELEEKERAESSTQLRIRELESDLARTQQDLIEITRQKDIVSQRSEEKVSRRDARIRQLTSVVKEAISWIDGHEEYGGDKETASRFREMAQEPSNMSQTPSTILNQTPSRSNFLPSSPVSALRNSPSRGAGGVLHKSPLPIAMPPPPVGRNVSSSKNDTLELSRLNASPSPIPQTVIRSSGGGGDSAKGFSSIATAMYRVASLRKQFSFRQDAENLSQALSKHKQAIDAAQEVEKRLIPDNDEGRQRVAQWFRIASSISGFLSEVREMNTAIEALARQGDVEQVRMLVKKREGLRKSCNQDLDFLISCLRDLSEYRLKRKVFLEVENPTLKENLNNLMEDLDISGVDPRSARSPSRMVYDKDMTSEIVKAIDRYVEAEKHISDSAMRTDHCLSQLMEALLAEEDSLQEPMEEVRERANDLALVAMQFTSFVDYEENLLPSNATFSLTLSYSLLEKDIDASGTLLKEAEMLAEQAEEQKSKLKATQVQQIKLRAKVETLGVLQSGDWELQVATKELKMLDSELQEAKKKIAHTEDRLREMTRQYPEFLLTMSAVTDHARGSLAGTPKLILERQLHDYEQIRVMTETYFKSVIAKYKEQVYIIREYAFDTELFGSRKRFEVEISRVAELPSHPLVIPIEGIFYDQLRAYSQSPFVKGVTLHDYLHVQDRSKVEINRMFLNILQGVAFIHSHGVVHQDLSHSSVVVTTDKSSVYPRPMITDFGVYLDPHRPPGQGPAPEIASEGRWTPASDMWSFGVMLFRAHFPYRDPVLGDTKDAVDIPVDDHADLRDLLSRLLQRSPENRLSAQEALMHPFFVDMSLPAMSTLQSKALESSDQRLRKLVLHIYDQRKATRHQRITLKIQRRGVVDSMLQEFMTLQPREMMFPMRFEMIGKLDVDAPDPASNMYGIFFEKSFGNSYSIWKPSTNGQLFMLNQENKSNFTFESLGRITAKCLYDGFQLPVEICPALFKFLAGAPPDLQDLEAFDPDLAHQLKWILITPIGMQENKYLFFPDGRAVTDENKALYVKEHVFEALFGSAHSQLESFKKGFQTLDLSGYTSRFTSMDYRLWSRHSDFIDPTIISDLLHFDTEAGRFCSCMCSDYCHCGCKCDCSCDFDVCTPKQFLRFLNSIPSNHLRRMLELLTGMDTMSGGFRAAQYAQKHVTIVKGNRTSNLPQSFPSLGVAELPNYRDLGALQISFLSSISLRAADSE